MRPTLGRIGMSAAMSLEVAAPRTVRPQRLCDEQVVQLAAAILRDPRAWAATGNGTLDPAVARDAARRAIGLLREALETV